MRSRVLPSLQELLMDALQRCDPRAERIVAQHIDRLEQARRRTPDPARKPLDRYLSALRAAHCELSASACTTRTLDNLRRAHADIMACFRQLALQTRGSQRLLAMPASLATLEHLLMAWLNREETREAVTAVLEQLRYRYQEAWSELQDAARQDLTADLDSMLAEVETSWQTAAEALDQMQEAIDSGDEVALMPAWLSLTASFAPLRRMQHRLFAAA
ncbi:MAG: hypothetical protein ACYCW6_24050 [Candidatus Xenobia bacterium]